MSGSRPTEYHDDQFEKYVAEQAKLCEIRTAKENDEAYTREQAKQTSASVSYYNKVLSDLARLLGVITILHDRFSLLLRAIIPWGSVVTMIISSLLKIIIAATISTETIPTRIMKSVTGTAGLALGIIGIAVATAVVAAAAMIIDLFHNIWEIGEIIHDRDYGSWKQASGNVATIKATIADQYENYLQVSTALTKVSSSEKPDLLMKTQLQEQAKYIEADLMSEHRKLVAAENQEREYQLKLANKTHTTIISAVSLVGFGLALNPATAVVGAAMLIGVAVYSVLDTLNINPFRYVAGKIFGNPFSPKEPVKSFDLLKPELDKRLAKNNVPEQAAVAAKQTNSNSNIYAKIGSPSTMREVDATSVANDVSSKVNNRNEPTYVDIHSMSSKETASPNPVFTQSATGQSSRRS